MNEAYVQYDTYDGNGEEPQFSIGRKNSRGRSFKNQSCNFVKMVHKTLPGQGKLFYIK